METRSRLVRRAIALSIASITFSGLIGVVAAATALTTGSLAVLGFGVDAVIDSIASVALVWRFVDETRMPHRAERVERAAEGAVGVALLLLSAYLAVGAVRQLGSGAHPDQSAIAIALLLLSVVALPPLAMAKSRVAARLSSRALRADAILTFVAAGLAAVGLTSIALDAWFGLSWADSVAALAISLVVVREGLGAVSSAREAAG